ncbi:MAG: alpha/beta hydrolase [Clostridia bacterium]|nr:alpha/beta hydrolase [Clostridia bacterium]
MRQYIEEIHCAHAASEGSGSGFLVSGIQVSFGDEHLGGKLYTPVGPGPWPLVICSHGFTGTYENLVSTCEMLTQIGVAGLCFDFRNGTGSLSSGDFLKMSVETEVMDLTLLTSYCQHLPVIRPDKIVLLGHSQGGLVSALTAARHPDAAAGLILVYPAFSIVDDVHSRFPDRDHLPDTYSVLGATVGRPFAEDIWDLDVYSEIAAYRKPVLIMHGTDDEIVDISCSERAAGIYSQATFIPIEGAGHGFRGDALQKSFAAIRKYLQDIGMAGSPG